MKLLKIVKGWFELKEPTSAAELNAYERKIGMHKLKNKAKQAGKFWLACSAQYLNGAHRGKTKYKISYWVNYGDSYDDQGTYGWFTVEQIKEWLSTPKLKLKGLGGNIRYTKKRFTCKRIGY